MRRFALAGLLALLPACQVIGASITSPSDWLAGSSEAIANSSESISTSSGSGGSGAVALQRDLRAWMVVSVQRGDDVGALLRGVGAVTAEHGVVDWEASADALVALGAGLADAGLSEARLLELQPALVGDDAARAALLWQGFRSAGG